MRAHGIAVVVVSLALAASLALAKSPARAQASAPSRSSAPLQSSAPSQSSAAAQPPVTAQPPSQPSAMEHLPQASAESQPSQAPQPTPPSQPAQTPQPPERPKYSADGLYNLANSYARAGQPGLAVLNYERAALLAPNDSDINANLEYVRAAAQVPPELRSRFARIAQAATPTLSAWIGVLGIALVGAGLLAKRIARRFRWLRAASALFGVTLIALAVSNAMLLWPRMHEAVILLNQTPARVSPVPMGDTAFVLREAETVTMTAEHEDFVLIRTRGGLSGWVARANLGAVVP